MLLILLKKHSKTDFPCFDVTQHEDVEEPTKEHLMWLVDIVEKKQTIKKEFYANQKYTTEYRIWNFAYKI